MRRPGLDVSASRRLAPLGALSLAFLLILGCSRSRPRFEDLPVPSISELKSRAEANRRALKDFVGVGLIEMSGSQIGHSILGVKLRYVQPDDLELTLTAAMGIRLGSLRISDNRYSLLYGMPPVHASGLLAELVFPDLALDLQGDDIFNVLLPLQLMSSIPDTASVEKDAGVQRFRMSWSAGKKTYCVWMDPFRPVFVRELVLSAVGDTLADKELAKVRKRTGVHVPSAWSVRLGSGDGADRIHLELSRLDVNTGLTQADLLPKGAAQADSSEVHLGR